MATGTKKAAPSRKAAPGVERVFKTKHFAAQASNAGITDAELCQAASELALGQGDDLGGGVWKKRLKNNMYRAIVLRKVGAWWIYVYLFAKSARANITKAELVGFKKLSKDYAAGKPKSVNALVANGELLEICKK